VKLPAPPGDRRVQVGDLRQGIADESVHALLPHISIRPKRDGSAIDRRDAERGKGAGAGRKGSAGISDLLDHIAEKYRGLDALPVSILARGNAIDLRLAHGLIPVGLGVAGRNGRLRESDQQAHDPCCAAPAHPGTPWDGKRVSSGV